MMVIKGEMRFHNVACERAGISCAHAKFERVRSKRPKVYCLFVVLAVFVMKRLGLRARFSLLLERWGVCCVGPNPNLNPT